MRVHVCVRVRVHVCACVYVHARVCACVCACMCAHAGWWHLEDATGLSLVSTQSCSGIKAIAIAVDCRVLPLPCAGGYGPAVRGLYRVHQFSKVELFAVTEGEGEGEDGMLEEMVALQEEICVELGLHYR